MSTRRRAAGRQRSDDDAGDQATVLGHARPQLLVREQHGEQRDEYVYALSSGPGPSLGRVQLQRHSGLSSSDWWSSLPMLLTWLRECWRSFLSVFLPVGYPASVTPDYLEFQIWDTVQAVCSYLRGMLCTHAVLTGMGVGEATASATSATLSWVLRDGVGMAGGLFFAWWGARSFGANLRGWRLFADVINDVGLTLELVSPLFPREYFWLFLSAGCVCRSLCGVSAGATRAALMQHFARAGNVADLAAKEGIQETAVTLVGMLGGAALMHWMDGDARATWILFALLTALHVYANWRGVTALVLASLNPQRTDLLLRHWVGQMIAHEDPEPSKTSPATPQAWTCLTPAQAAQRERLIWWEGSSSSSSSSFTPPLSPLGIAAVSLALPPPRPCRIRVGMAMHELVASADLLQQIVSAQAVTLKDVTSTAVAPTEPAASVSACAALTHLLCPQDPSAPAPAVLGVVLRDDCSEQQALRALFHAHIYRALLQQQQQQQQSSGLARRDGAPIWLRLARRVSNCVLWPLRLVLLSPPSARPRSSPLSAGERTLLHRSSQLCALHFPSLLVSLQSSGWTLEHAVLSIEAWRCRWD